MFQSLRVSDAPVARDTDPITSFEAGENPAAREASEQAVLAVLRYFEAEDLPAPSDHMLELNAEPHNTFTPQRIRTARAQLVRKGLVESAGRVEGASPTGRAAMTWKLADR